MEKLYSFYISSSYSDLIEERRAINDIIISLNQTYVGYEFTQTSDDTPFDVRKKALDTSDYIILIIGRIYGNISNEGISYVEAEYNYAVLNNKPVLAFILHDESLMIMDIQLYDFEKRISEQQYVHYWHNIDDLKFHVLFSLFELFQNNNNKLLSKNSTDNNVQKNKDNNLYKEELKNTLGIYTTKENNDIIGLMINNLSEIRQFYELTKVQADNAYKLAKNSCIAGICLIVISVLIALIFNNNQIAMATTVGGVVVEALAGTSLFVYQKTLKQLNYYYASLHNNERFLSLINIVGKTNIKDELYSKIVESELDNLKQYEIKNDKTQ